MARLIDNSKIVQFHKDIVRFHVELKGFYRFNFTELNGQLRKGVPTPVLLLESPSSQLARNATRTTFNNRDISCLVLDYAGTKADDFDKQEEVLTRMESICLDIGAYLEQQSQNRDSWLYGHYDANSFRCEKVGPIHGTMYGWNILYTLKNVESMQMNPEAWDFNAPELP